MSTCMKRMPQVRPPFPLFSRCGCSEDEAEAAVTAVQVAADDNRRSCPLSSNRRPKAPRLAGRADAADSLRF